MPFYRFSTALFLVCTIAAQDQPNLVGKSLEELMEIPIESVVTASRYRQRITEAPASVTVVTSEEIRRYGWRTLADVLQSVRGFHISYDRFYHYIGVRGFSRPGDFNARVLVLIDGHRVNENVYEGAYLEDGFPVSMDLVERIEIIRGPGSSLYGTNALSAVINVKMKRGGALAGTEISLEAGSLGSQRARITHGSSSSKMGEVLISATGFTSGGQPTVYAPEFDLPMQGSDGRLHGVDRERAANAFLSWQRGHWTVEAAGSTRRKHYPPLYQGQDATDARNYGQDTRGYLDLNYTRDIGERTTVMGRAYVDRYLFDGHYPYLSEGGTVISREFANGTWWGGEFQMNHRQGRHQITGGVELRFQPLVHLATYDSNPYYFYGGSRASPRNHGVFVQDEWTLHPKLRLTAGIRADYYSTFGRTVNPRMALVFQPARRSSLKLAYGQAFRAPNPYELSYETATFQANPALVPEQIQTAEFSWEQYWSRGWRTVFSSFHNRVSRVISQVPIPGDQVQYQNQGRFTGWGAEAEIAYQQKDGWDFLASYGFQPFHDDSLRLWLPNSPRHLVKIRVSRPILRQRLIAAAELLGVSRRLTVQRAPVSGYWWPSLTLTTRRWRDHVDVSASIYNLSNTNYSDPIGDEFMTQALQQNGRTFRLQVRFRF